MSPLFPYRKTLGHDLAVATVSEPARSQSVVKYPRTYHLQGSRLLPGDDDASQVSIESLATAQLVIEEKLDGANAALSFSSEGALRLQSRGYLLAGGPRERHFAMFKTWAATIRDALHPVLRDRYVVYGEWLYAKHTVFYDALPHWFMEFDVWDRESACFLSTPRRHALLAGTPIVSVPVIHEGVVHNEGALRGMIMPSLYKTKDWREVLSRKAASQELDVQRVLRQTDPHVEGEGLYIKHERDGAVVGRYKFIRPSFSQAVIDSDGHWLDRPIIANELADGVDILAQG